MATSPRATQSLYLDRPLEDERSTQGNGGSSLITFDKDWCVKTSHRRHDNRGLDGDRRGLQRSETSRSVGSLAGGRATMTSLGGKTVVSGRNLRSSLSKSVESVEQVGCGHCRAPYVLL